MLITGMDPWYSIDVLQPVEKNARKSNTVFKRED